MNPTQFTLPWQVIETDCGEHVYVTDAEGNQVVRLSKELVSIAHLIAAAPDLLDSLQALHEYCRENDSAYRNGINGTDQMYATTRNAIQKAMEAQA